MAYGPPPGSAPPPPPGAGYGPPAGGSSGFDPKSVNPLDWAPLAAALVAFIFSFINYYTADLSTSSGCPPQVKAAAQSAVNSSNSTESAWHGFFGWFGILLAIIGAVLLAISLFAPHVKLPVPARLAALGAFALATLSLLLAMFIDPEKGKSVRVAANCTFSADVGRGVGYWVSLIAVILGLVALLMRFRQTGGQLPGRGSSGSTALPSSGYGQQSAPGFVPPTQQSPAQAPPQGGYAPPAQPGYQPPPPAQQPGFQPPPPPQQPGYGQQPPPGYTPPPPPA